MGYREIIIRGEAFLEVVWAGAPAWQYCGAPFAHLGSSGRV